jgi:hypothetical protein
MGLPNPSTNRFNGETIKDLVSKSRLNSGNAELSLPACLCTQHAIFSHICKSYLGILVHSDWSGFDILVSLG